MGYFKKLDLALKEADVEEEKRLDRREWGQNTWRYPRQQSKPKRTVGYVFGYEVDIRGGEFRCERGPISPEEAIGVFRTGHRVWLVEDGEYRDVVSAEYYTSKVTGNNDIVFGVY